MAIHARGGRNCGACMQVMESTHSVRDGRTGEERMRLTRGLGDRQRTMERARRHGRETVRNEHLQVRPKLCMHVRRL
jgi:hypothetical protein